MKELFNNGNVKISMKDNGLIIVENLWSKNGPTIIRIMPMHGQFNVNTTPSSIYLENGFTIG
jgi:hypothetical protein